MIPKFFVIDIFLILSLGSININCGDDQGGSGAPKGGGGGPSGGGGGGGGNGGGNCGLKVSISFDSLHDKSISFMKGAVQPIFEELSSCVQWDFIPCSTSHRDVIFCIAIVEDVLQCKDGVEECKIDALHACASHYFKDDPNNLAKFFICMMTSGDQMAEAQKCCTQSGLDWNKLKGCKPCNEAGQWCDNRYKLLNQLHEAKVPGVMFNLKYDCAVEDDAMNDLKGTICQQIQQNNMQCPACSGCGGGGGKGGGGGGGPSGGSPGGGGSGGKHGGSGGSGGGDGGLDDVGGGGGGNGGGGPVTGFGTGPGGIGKGTDNPKYAGCVPGSIGVSDIVGAGDPPSQPGVAHIV